MINKHLKHCRLLLEVQGKLKEQEMQSYLAQVLHKDLNAEQLKVLSEHVAGAFDTLMVSL